MFQSKKPVLPPAQRPEARFGLDRELRRLQDKMLSLSSLVAWTILEALDIFHNRRQQAAAELIQSDRRINARRYEIEADCLQIIARQHPVATDLRLITAVMDIATELERISDYAKGIARITLLLDPAVELPAVPEMMKMGVMVQGMLRRAILAFIERDLDLAYRIAAQDAEVDELYETVFTRLMKTSFARPEEATMANYLLFATHNLERTGDRAVNICERVLFIVTGRFVELDEVPVPDRH